MTKILTTHNICRFKMDSEPLLKNAEHNPVKSVEKSHIRNLLFGYLVLFIITVSYAFQYPDQSQYIYRRVSEEVFGNSSASDFVLNQTCYVNTSDPRYILQEKAQGIAAEKNMQYTILRTVLATFSIIMLGAYSDVVGRKFLFVIPLTGDLIKFVITTVVIYWNLDLDYFFLAEGIDGLMGGYFSILLASNAYTADNTPSTGARTMGIAIVEFCVNLGSAAVSTGAGYFIQDEGFFYPMLVPCILCFIDIVLVLFWLPERKEIKRKEDRCFITPWEGFKRVFGFYLLDGSKRQRLCFVLTLLALIFTCLPLMGGFQINILFQLNFPFCWSPQMVGYYRTAESLSVQFLGIPLLRLLQCCCLDEVIGVIGTLTMVASNVLQSFSYNTFMMYAVLVVRIPFAGVLPVCRAILSKMAPADKQGSLFASIAVLETLCSLVGSLIFSTIYQHTVLVWRGLVFIIMGAVSGVTGILLIIYIIISKSEREKKKMEDFIIQHECEGTFSDTEVSASREEICSRL